MSDESDELEKKFNLNNKKIGILGWGLENQALVGYLLKHKARCEITICDRRKDIIKKWISPASCGMGMTKKGMEMTKIKWQLGQKFNKNLEKFDILFRSPGWPIDCSGIKSAVRAGTALSSPMKLFFDLCSTKNIIGVTGTKGKGTTASLIYVILKEAGKRVWLGGNIGLAPFEFIDKIRASDWVVLELSSFQLEDMTVSPHIAVFTNFYPEHLMAADPNNPNYHKSLKDYWRAKVNVIKLHKNGDWTVMNNNLKFKILNFKLRSKIIYFKKSGLPSNLVGGHNEENIAAAAATAKIVGVKPGIIKKAVANFKGLPHRLELVRKVKGVQYYDDSFATTSEATIIALKSFARPIVLLLGGADKGADFKKLATEVKKRAKFAVLLNGAATSRIRRELLRVGFRPEKMKLAYNIKAALKLAARNAARGEVVLLSTACASFGMFRNYKERGDLFKAEVRKLK
jgi:UDP-N-acetylmuramoylalanine--D-glutamate ligase